MAATLVAQDKPNVIVIMADDLGYGDVSCYGATELETPNIDRLAAEGLTRARCSDAVRGRGRVRGEMLGCGARVRCSGAVPVASQVHAGARRARLRQGARLRLRGIG